MTCSRNLSPALGINAGHWVQRMVGLRLRFRGNWHVRTHGGLLLGVQMHFPSAIYYRHRLDESPRWCVSWSLHLLVGSIHADLWLWPVDSLPNNPVRDGEDRASHSPAT